MRLTYKLILLLTFATIVFAQAPDTLWTKTYGEYGFSENGYAVVQTSDGGYFITGVWLSDFIALVKTDSLGDTLWARIGGRGDGYAVDQAFDGGYFIGGTDDHGVFYIVRVDSLGGVISSQAISGFSCNSIQETSDSGSIAVGTGSGAQSHDVLLAKTILDGTVIWAKYLGDLWEDDVGSSIQQTEDGGFIIAGRTRGFGAANMDVYLVRTDSLGDSLWNKIYGSPSSDVGMDLDQTSDGGYVITGYYGHGGRDVYLIKTDSIGNLIWEKTYGGSEDDEGWSVQQTMDGGYIIAGYTKSFGPGTPVRSNIYIVRTDSNGDTLWTQTYGGTRDDWGGAIQVTSDGGYIITGQIFVDHGGGQWSDDIVLMRMANDVAVKEENIVAIKNDLGSSILNGPIVLPKDRNCRVFDITGRVMVPDKIKPGIYFIEVDGEIQQKVVKIR